MVRQVAAAAVAAFALLALYAHPSTARTTAFGLAATQACLNQHGATFGSASDPAIAALPARQRAKVLAGVLPPGTVLLYLVIGSSSSDAVTLRDQIAKTIQFRPTTANSRVGLKGNAAWFIESIAGQRPPIGLSNTVSNCLRTGPTTTTPKPITLSELSDCVNAHSGMVLGPRERRLLFPPVPSAVSSHMIASLIPGSSGASQGIFGFVLIGRNVHESLTFRGRLTTALAGHLAGAQTGQERGVAWLTIPTKRASTAQVRKARRIFDDCLA